jgi:hypothetical protein
MMAEFIANRILEAREVSTANGKAKYKSYFVQLKIYARYKTAVDAILTAEGAEDCIVTE